MPRNREQGLAEESDLPGLPGMPRPRNDDDIPFAFDDLVTSANGSTPPSPITATPPGTLPVDFDLEALRLRQDFDQLAGTRKVVTTIQVRKPKKFEFVRTRPETEWYPTVVYESEEDRAYYLVRHGLLGELAGQHKPVTLVPTILRSGDVFLWPLRLPGADGKTMDWWTSAYEAAQLAQTSWLRLAANQSTGSYDIFLAEHQTTDPVWPDLARDALLRLAFRRHYIDQFDHPALKKLRGAV